MANQLETILDEKGIVLFFTQKGNLFGSDEDSRIVFAKMKNPDDEDYEKPLEFEGWDLRKLLGGNDLPTTFSKKDISSIKVIDEKTAKDILSKEKIKKPSDQKDSEVPVGTIFLKDKK